MSTFTPESKPAVSDGSATLSATLLNSRAYRRLPPRARATLIEFYRAYTGKNNGRISMSLAKLISLLGLTQITVQRALQDLQDAGFIVEKEQGSAHKPTLWALTEFPVGEEPATRGFLEPSAPFAHKEVMGFMAAYPISQDWAFLRH